MSPWDHVDEFLTPKKAVALSVMLCLPFLFVNLTAAFEWVPKGPFGHLFLGGGQRPSVLGYALMFLMLINLPVAFIINFFAMVTKASSAQRVPFKPSPAHTFLGLAILGFVLILMRPGVEHELRPFLDPLGSAALLGQILFFLVLLVLPVSFLLNLLPLTVKAASGGAYSLQPSSLNLIVGAAILLVIVMLLSAFLLESTACLMGVPNCD